MSIRGAGMTWPWLFWWEDRLTVPYTNPYSGAWYFGYQDTIDNGPIPLQPCAGAYSIGPALTDTSLTLAWVSYGFGGGGNCNLIKDEDDVFYYASYLAPNVYIQVYDAPTDTETVYSITPPAGLSAFITANAGLHWMIRKASETVLDVVACGFTDVGATRNFEHYTWSIGGTSLTYVDGFSHTINSGDVEGNLCAALHGPLVIDGYYDFLGDGGNPCYYVKTYNLDTQGKTDTLLFNRAGKLASMAGFYHGGANVYAVVISSEVTAVGGDCPQVPGVETRDVNQSCILGLDGIYFDFAGSAHTISDTLDEVAGHDCFITQIDLSGGDYLGIKPNNGWVYIQFSYKRAYSDSICPDDPYVVGFPGVPEFADDISGVYKICDSPDWEDQNISSSDPNSGSAGTHTHTVGPSRWNLSSHSSPSSLSDPDANNLPSIYFWPSLSAGAGEDVFTPAYYGGAIGKQVGDGGQRNDNTPISLSTHYQEQVTIFRWWHNVVRDLGGGIYLDQTSDLSGGATTGYLPVTGYMGKWPVRFNRGGWAIFGPNTPVETVGPNWQVV